MARRRKKTEYGKDLFMTHPPESPRRVKQLFCGREAALEIAVGKLKTDLDLKGRTVEKRPWVIHGESRSGKSHLARRVLCELLKKDSAHQQVIISARERLEARNVMRRLFEELSRLYRELIDGISLEPNSVERSMNELAIELMDRTSVLVSDDHADSVRIQIRESLASAVEAGASFDALPKLFRIFRRRKHTESTQESWEATFGALSALDLAEFCAALIDTMRHLGVLEHIFILFDDVDLLEGYKSAEQNGRIQRSILTDALIELHHTPCVDVILTARSWYAQNNREIQTLIDLLHEEDLDLDAMVEIHDRHFKAVVGRKSLPKEFLTREALQTLADDANGLPGVFLQHLKTAFDQYIREEDWGLRDGSWLLGQFRKIFQRYARLSPELAEMITKTVQSGKFTIDVLENPFHNTRFLDEFVFQGYFGESNYFFTRLLRRVIEPAVPNAQIIGVQDSEE